MFVLVVLLLQRRKRLRMRMGEVTIKFGTGEITGRCMEDVICVGDVCSRGAFIAATEETAHPFASFAFDGVLGLALSGMAQSPSFSMMSAPEVLLLLLLKRLP